MAKTTTKASKATPTKSRTLAMKAIAAPARKRRVAAAKSAKATPAPGAARRAIFIDVENTSSEAALFDTIDSLAIDQRAQPTQLAAVGNWRAVNQTLGRRLGSLGAQLVHSAPARGVRDWSDLWIAVAAGCWLGQASAGDILEIVSNDRAFDAVGDAAAARGVIFRRLQHRPGAATQAQSEPRQAVARGGRRRGGRGRGRRQPGDAIGSRTAPVAAASSGNNAPHGASAAQMAELIQRLTHGEAARWVNLDVLEKALKTEGFSRPPGSPRLVTRLRALKEMEVDSHGRVRLRPHLPSDTQGGNDSGA